MEEVSGDNYIIELSEKSQGFLDTTSVKLYASDSSIKLNKNDDVFIKFNNIYIHNKELNFASIELYKYYETIEKNIIGHVTWFVPNDFGGILQFDGVEFEFNGNKYVDFDDDISEDGKQYFPVFPFEHLPDGNERFGVTVELEDPQQPHQTDRPDPHQIHGQNHGQIKGKYGQKIDNGHAGGDVFQPGLQRGTPGKKQIRRPDPQQILHAEDDQRRLFRIIQQPADPLRQIEGHQKYRQHDRKYEHDDEDDGG